MKLFLANLLVMLAFGAFVGAEAKTIDTVRVQVNHQKRAPISGVRIRFIELVEDSRCPVDVNCIQAGNAKIRVEVSKYGRSKMLELNTNGRRKQATFAGYNFELTKLTPQPRSNIRIDRNGYVATITIDRSR